MTSTHLRTAFLLTALLIVTASVLYTNNLASRLADEERKKMEIWAEATRQFILADENTDIDFFSTIMEGNTTIPVYMVDAEGNLLLSRNVTEPKHNRDGFYQNKIKRLQSQQTPIEVRINDDITQYIYYEDSTLLRQLHWFPYVEFLIIFLFVSLIIITLYMTQRNEQNRVWVGLSKETAHQLGTPISALWGWQTLLADKYPQDRLIPEMGKDIDRLRTIADRFSKVGSLPELSKENLTDVLRQSVAYMRSRTSDKITYQIDASKEPQVMLNRELFGWVIENLCRNAVDAIGEKGSIKLSVETNGNIVYVDVTDSGKGIPSGRFKKVFQPGYTTKQRGWGLGLSLAKRIIEDYHKGKIYVLRSQQNAGTTFRIQLQQTAEDLIQSTPQ